jgi:hypothetical protein
MKDDPVRSFAQNNQLDAHIRKLNLLVHQKLPNIAFPFGDVISMAGKVAIEYVLPCIRIKWRPGRPPCGLEKDGAPGAEFQTYNEFQGHLDRYKFTRKEFAVLLAGSHGLKEAVLHVSSTQIPWVQSNSGLEFIKDSLTKSWNAKSSSGLKLQTPMPHVFFMDEKKNDLIRLPVDMIFYPKTVQKSKNTSKLSSIVVEQQASTEETYLKGFLNRDETHFNKVFADVFAKMLEIGVNDDEMGPWYNDKPDPHFEKPSSQCPNGYYYSTIANIP